MNYYAAGGQAQNLASYGRGGDTELVHMSKGEIKGLQDLALAYGGSLSINPNTGLVEAGFLRRILPVVAGAALTIGSGGALSPLAASLIVGGGYGLATGSITKGLMAGLGAYGGAGLGTGLMAAGTTTAEGVIAEQVARDAVGQQVSQEAVKEAALQGTTLPGDYSQLVSQTATPQQIAAQKTIGQSFTQAGRGLGALGTETGRSAAYAAMPTGTLPTTAASLLLPDQQGGAGPAGYQEDEYDRELKGYRLSPNYQAYEAPRPNPYYQATYAAAGGVMNSFDDENGSDTNMATGGQINLQGTVNLDQNSMGPQGQISPGGPGGIGTPQLAVLPRNYEPLRAMATGGIAHYKNKGQVNVLQEYLNRQAEQQAQQSGYLPESVGIPRTGIFRDPDVDTAKKPADEATGIKLGKAFKAAGIKPVALPKTAIRGLGDISGITRDTTEVAKGGVMSSLGGYSDGGRMLRGPGDGMSDSIPATIANKQPARLADGEFVVPADVVSHLGNGSTDAGAKKLYSMMDKIRKARTGKKKQAPAVTASRYMPA